MSQIKIDWLYSQQDCETCGFSGASGAIVTVDDVEVLNLRPIASCTSPRSWEVEDVFALLLQHLGHSTLQRNTDLTSVIPTTEQFQPILGDLEDEDA